MAVTFTHRAVGSIRRLTFDVTAAGDGSVAACELPRLEGHWLKLTTIPLSPAPTNGFNVRVLSEGGIDQLQDCGASRSNAAAQETVVRYAGKNLHPAFAQCDALTLSISGNSVPDARLTVDLFYGTGYR